MLKLGNTTINKLMLGSTEAKKVYLGSTLVHDTTVGGSYLLDTYSGAEAAYSLRQLKTGVTSVVKVRRTAGSPATADFTATEITDGTLAAWVGVGNDGFVDTWFDQSGNGRNQTQSTTTLQPKIVSNGAVLTDNGNPCLEFTTAALYRFTSATFTGHTSCTFIAAYRNTGGKLASAFGVVFMKGTGHTSPNTGIFDRSSSSRLLRPYFYTGSAFVGDTATDAHTPTSSEKLLLFHNIIGGTNQTFHVNNTLKFTDTTALSPETTNRPLFIGGGQANAALSANAWEFIYFGTSQAANRAAIESDINTKYGIY
jgi:hypothetical protein